MSHTYLCIYIYIHTFLYLYIFIEPGLCSCWFASSHCQAATAGCQCQFKDVQLGRQQFQASKTSQQKNTCSGNWYYQHGSASLHCFYIYLERWHPGTSYSCVLWQKNAFKIPWRPEWRIWRWSFSDEVWCFPASLKTLI